MDRPRQLAEEWTSTQAQLEHAWRQVGLSASEQKKQLDLLFAEVEALFKRKIETESALCSTYADEVAKLKVRVPAWTTHPL